jgi:hypothetical protein
VSEMDAAAEATVQDFIRLDEVTFLRQESGDRSQKPE